MDNLIIRKGLKKDVDKIISINRENWLLTYPNQELGITKEDIQKFLDSFYETQKESLKNTIEEKDYYIAELGDRVVGYCRYKEIESQIFEIKTMYIDPDFQGLGVGSQIFKAVLRDLKDFKELFLFVTNYNTKAIKFYKKIGFVLSPDNEKEKIEIGENKFITNIKMVYGK